MSAARMLSGVGGTGSACDRSVRRASPVGDGGRVNVCKGLAGGAGAYRHRSALANLQITSLQIASIPIVWYPAIIPGVSPALRRAACFIAPGAGAVYPAGTQAGRHR